MKRRRNWWLQGLMLALGVGTAITAINLYRRRFSFSGKVVIITGGSRGLGLLMARRLVAEGARVALLARREEELRRAETDLRARGGQVFWVTCDLSKQVQVNDAIARIYDHFGRIDVLINNAGIIQVGPLEHMTVADFEQAMGVHFWGPLYASLAVIPRMKQVGGGRIVNIASIGGKIAVPHMTPYSASKFALVGLSDAFRAELRKDNIFVTTICPGLMRTGSPPQAQVKGKHQSEYAWFSVSGSLPLISMDADRAARKIINACRNGSGRVILGVHAKAAVLLSELFPGAAAEITAYANRLLPRPSPDLGTESRAGWESESTLTHSWLTRLSYYAALKNNERPPEA